MCMRITVAFVVQCPVCDHAFAYEVVLNETPDTFDLFFATHLGRQGNFDLTGELGVRSFLDLLHFVPQNFAVLITLRSIGRKHDLAKDNAALAGEVVRNAGLVVIQLLAGSVSGRSYGGSATRTTDDFYRAMIYCHLPFLLSLRDKTLPARLHPSETWSRSRSEASLWVSKRATPFGAVCIRPLGERTVMWAPPTYKCALNKLRDGVVSALTFSIVLTLLVLSVHRFSEEVTVSLLLLKKIQESDLVFINGGSA